MSIMDFFSQAEVVVSFLTGLIALGVFIYGIVKKIKWKEWFKGAAPFVLILFLAIAIASLSYTVYVTQFSPNPTPPPPTVSVSISSPLNNSNVGYVLNVSGTWQNVSNGQKLWLVVYSHTAQRYYPQQEAKLRTIEGQPGSWNGVAYLGIKNGTINEKFDLVPVLASKDASSNFSKSTGSFEGYTNLPNGAIEYPYVTVTRVQ